MNDTFVFFAVENQEELAIATYGILRKREHWNNFKDSIAINIDEIEAVLFCAMSALYVPCKYF